jgi:hypothetical protein
MGVDGARRPGAAARTGRRFESGVNKAIVTLPGDGAGRINPLEMEFDDGEVSFPIRSGSARLLDLHRDPASRSIAR